MSVICSIVILYAKYLAKTLRMVWWRNKNVPRPKQAMLFRLEQYQYPFR